MLQFSIVVQTARAAKARRLDAPGQEMPMTELGYLLAEQGWNANAMHDMKEQAKLHSGVTCKTVSH
jgi:hypothetical protein